MNEPAFVPPPCSQGMIRVNEICVPVQNVPTLGEWSLIGLTVLILVAAWRHKWT